MSVFLRWSTTKPYITSLLLIASNDMRVKGTIISFITLYYSSTHLVLFCRLPAGMWAGRWLAAGPCWWCHQRLPNGSTSATHLTKPRSTGPASCHSTCQRCSRVRRARSGELCRNAGKFEVWCIYVALHGKLSRRFCVNFHSVRIYKKKYQITVHQSTKHYQLIPLLVPVFHSFSLNHAIMLI